MPSRERELNPVQLKLAKWENVYYISVASCAKSVYACNLCKSSACRQNIVADTAALLDIGSLYVLKLF